jgi:hypothetical protein
MKMPEEKFNENGIRGGIFLGPSITFEVARQARLRLIQANVLSTIQAQLNSCDF